MRLNHKEEITMSKRIASKSIALKALAIIKVNTKITKKGKIKITNLDNFLLYRIVKVFNFI